MDFRDKHITIMGLGVAGGAVEDALFFIRQGAHVTVTDTKTEAELASSVARLKGQPVTLHLGGHREEDFTKADLILRNPAVPSNSPFLDTARRHHVPIEMGSGLFSELADLSKLIGITGTKGKSTTTALTHAVVRVRHPDAYCGGNVDGSPLKFVDEANRGQWGVMELSSWRLESMAEHEKSPHVALITNIAQDHLNRYERYEDYREAKKHIFRFQNKDDIAILNADDGYLLSVANEVPSTLLWFSVLGRPDAPGGSVGVYLKEGTLHYGEETALLAKLSMRAVHHPANIVAALTVGRVLDVPFAKALKAIAEVPTLPGRLEYVATVSGVAFYNDTTATNPYAAKTSLERMAIQGSVSIIVGGEDKRMDFSELAEALSQAKAVFVLPGTASEKLLAQVARLNVPHVTPVATLREAVEGAFASKADIVLLSPAAASFNMFVNEFDRGDTFVKEVQRLHQHAA
ncbi:MAG: UDP-N-acetylmuramoyl-L-alanine--D-glutamate ligase [Candidatus Spechtbacterales bacterium]